MADPNAVDKMLDELLKGKKPEEILGEGGLAKELTKRLVERALQGEMTAHLGYEKHAPEGYNTGNSRNGKTQKQVLADTGEMSIEVPRDRSGTFEPQLVPKRQRRLAGFDDKVIALYARGMTTREIQGHLKELYGTEVSPALISAVTAAVLEDVQAWQSRPLDPLYPIVYLDAIHLKLRTDGRVQSQAVYLALGITIEGKKELLGLWVSMAVENPAEVALENSPTPGCRGSAGAGCQGLLPGPPGLPPRDCGFGIGRAFEAFGQQGGMLPEAIRVALDLDDDGVVQQAVEECCSDDVVAEDLSPLLESTVRSQDHRAAFIAGID